MWEAAATLFGAAFTIAVCIALGAAAFGAALEAWPERFACGAALLHLAIFSLCCVQLAYPAVFAAAGAIILYFWLRRARAAPQKVQISNYLLAIAFAAYFILYFFNAMAPEASPDGAAYHLGFVARYLGAHGFHRITWNFYANFSEGMEMLFLFAFAFGRHSAAALVHFAFLIALVWQMFLYARRAGLPLLGACAALLVFASPVVGKDASSAYNDAALASAAFTLFALLQRWDEERRNKLLLPIGLIAGFAYALKYTGGVAILYAVGFVVWKSWRKRQLRALIPVAAAAAVMAVPWMAKDWLWVQNPVSPFFNRWFPNPYVTTSFEKEYRQYLSSYDLPSRWQIPWDVTVKGQLEGVLGPVFLLAPLGLLALRRREGRQLLLAGAVFGAAYFGNIGARFLIPPLPFVALAMMLGLANRTLAMALALAHAVISWPAVVVKYAATSAPGVWIFRKAIPFPYALRLRPESEYLTARLPQYGIDRLIDRITEPGASVLMYHAIPEAYTSRRVLVEYESEPNHIAGEILRTGFQSLWQPTWRAGFSFPRQPLRAFRVVETAEGDAQWRITELRAFDGATELPRAGWKASARPFPWGIENALDGNLATFWESGDAMSPGSYVEARFPAARALDSVLLTGAPSQSGLRLALEGETPSGTWKRLADEAETFTGSAPDLRRAAVEELKRRGIGYVLLFDDDALARAVRENGAPAGMVEIGQSSGARLYRLQ